MKLSGRLLAAALVGLGAAMATIGPAQAATPILIKSCVVVKPAPLSHKPRGTQITYVILGSKTVSSVTFAVGYRNASQHYLRRVTDVGTFSPGATIDHTLSLYNDVTYAGAQTSMCVPTEVKYAGGTVWVAPSQP
jgi:hypothetical protein